MHAGDLGAGFLAHQIGEPARQLAFVGFGIGAVQHVGNHQAEHVVAEEFEALIAAGAVARALERRNMGQRAFEHCGIGEPIADAIFESGRGALAAPRLFGELGRGGSAAAGACRAAGGFANFGGLGFLAATHRTSVNRRFQRTAQGQRHTSQAWASSRIEKKMICARPIRFSNGT